MTKQRRRIKNYWIHPRFQTRYIGTMVINALVSLMIFGFVVYSTYKDNYELILSLVPDPTEIKEKMDISQKLLLFNFFFAGTVFIVTTAVVGLIFSHKTAGPLFQIKSIAKKIHSGDASSRIKLRPGDDFREVAEHLNSAFDKLTNPTVKYYVLKNNKELSNIPMTVERLRVLLQQGHVSEENLVVDLSQPDKSPERLGTFLGIPHTHES